MAEPVRFRVADTRLGILNVMARMPFRFGSVSIDAIAQATLEVTIETADGRQSRGYAADFLSYKWFDKRPEKGPAEGTLDLIASIDAAADAYRGAGFASAFDHWRDLHPALEEASLARDHNRLGGNFGVSMVERATIDAIGRVLGQGFDPLVRGSALGIDEPSVFTDLPHGSVAAALPAQPRQQLTLRHTVGLADPLSAADLEVPINDSFPETLEQYLRNDGVRFLKIKVSGDSDADLQRLTDIWQVAAAIGDPISTTLDGNEQYASTAEFASLMEAIRAQPDLQDFYNSILFIEQPVERTACLGGPLDPAALEVIGKPLLIDEADGWTTAFQEATACGYQGVSHKNCKGVFRSFLNNALAAQRNAAIDENRYFLSAEDLSNLPVVSLQSDLAVVATLGISHVERNGHHFFRGLDHLSADERQAALREEGLYRDRNGCVALDIDNGQIDVSSLDKPGFGFASPPDMEHLIAPADWNYDMLRKKLDS